MGASNRKYTLKKGKLFDILRTFSKSENDAFVDFVRSPYFNKSRSVSKLLEVIIKYGPEYPEEKLENEELYRKVIGKGKFSNQVMKNLLSRLTGLAMDFMALQHKEISGTVLKLGKLRELNKRLLDKEFAEEREGLKTEIMKMENMLQMKNMFSYMMENESVEHLLRRGLQHETTGHFVDSGKFLITFFMIALSDILLNMRMNNFSFNIKSPPNFAEAFFECIDFEKFFSQVTAFGKEDMIRIMVYYLTLKCNLHPDDESYFKRFRSVLFSNLERFSKPELYSLFRSIESFCAQMVNSGNRRYYREMFELYNIQLKNGFYRLDGAPVSRLRFRNTYLSALRSGETEWALKYISDFENDLFEHGGTQVVDMAYAHCYFELGRYEDALERISRIKTNELYLKFDVRNIAIMCHYELGNIENVISMSKSYTQFIKNNEQLPRDYADKALRFANFTSTLLQMSDKRDKEGIEELLAEAKKHAIDRKMDWLIEKMEKKIET